MDKQDSLILPLHLGLIMDGNRRWAKQHTIPSMDGHLAGYNALKEVLEEVYDQGIKYVTLYAFSNENWSRESKEVAGIMGIFLKAVSQDLKTLVDKGVRIRLLGRRDSLSAKVVAAIDKVEADTQHLNKATLCVCLNYGGKQEIIDAARKCVRDGLAAEDITEESFESRLYAPDVPPIDLIVRTSGEQRLSNFMLWRAAYSDFYFVNKYWPDMTKQDVTDIISEYSRRQRRFGA